MSLTLQADSSWSPDTYTGSSVQGEIAYFFTVSGPTTGVPVPILIDSKMTGSYQTTAHGSENISMRLQVNSAPQSASHVFACGGAGSLPTNVPCANWTGTQSAITSVGYPNSIVMDYALSSNSGGSADAFWDPYIYIDPTFANASAYSISVSPGVGNVPTSASPEPASFLLVGPMLGLAIFLRRRAVQHAG